MRPLLRMRPEEEQAGVVFVGEEFEGGCVFERVDIVLLVEANCEGAFEGVEVFHGELNEGRAFCVVEEEGGFGIFADLRVALGADARCACRLGFSECYD